MSALYPKTEFILKVVENVIFNNEKYHTVGTTHDLISTEQMPRGGMNTLEINWAIDILKLTVELGINYHDHP